MRRSHASTAVTLQQGGSKEIVLTTGAVIRDTSRSHDFAYTVSSYTVFHVATLSVARLSVSKNCDESSRNFLISSFGRRKHDYYKTPEKPYCGRQNFLYV